MVSFRRSFLSFRLLRRKMDLDRLIEQIIERARAEGKFDNLEGRGRPLRLEENPYEDPNWRVAYRVLKNAGFRPDWLGLDL